MTAHNGPQLNVHAQGETLQPISRFQAAVIGDDIYLHTHRNTTDMLRLSKVEDGMLRCPHNLFRLSMRHFTARQSYCDQCHIPIIHVSVRLQADVCACEYAARLAIFAGLAQHDRSGLKFVYLRRYDA